jgi:heat shock protein HtpX
VLTALGAGLAAYAFNTGPEKILWATGARQIETPRTEDERRLVNVVDEMCIAAALPKPKLWIVPEQDPNAFATGLGPERAHVAVTEGLLQVLNRDELQAVIGHELGHVKNLDVKLMTTLAALVGAVVLISDGVSRSIFRGGLRVGGGGRGGKKGGAPALLVILLVVWLVSWMLAPIITQFLAMGVSRKREYLADAMSAQFTRNPLALAAALEKIEHAHAPTTAIKRGAEHLCIADPLGRRLDNREGFLADVFATHPPMGKRIALLKGMGYAALKRDGGATPR